MPSPNVFPARRCYSLTDQIRRSSRAVCGSLAEAWRSRRYPASFVSKLTHSEGEAAETQTWLQIAVECGYVPREEAVELFEKYDRVIGMLVTMSLHPHHWIPGDK